MTTSDKLREIAEPILADLFEAGMDAQEVGMPSFDMLKTSGYIDRKLSDLTALISEQYYPKEFLLWTGENCQYYPDTNEWMYFESPMTQQYFKGTDELFNYWKENEQEEHPTNKEKFDGNYLPDPD